MILNSRSDDRILSEEERHEKEINKLKEMIMSEFYIENRKSLIDTLVSHGKYAKMALLDIIDKLGDNYELKTYAIKKLETL